MTEPALELIGIEKRFFDFVALSGVSLQCDAGQVLGLVGENGAGKSTLLNVIGGIYQPDAGEMRLAGRRYAPYTIAAASAAGVALVHQELNLFANLNVAENLFLADFPMRGVAPLRWIDRAALRKRATEALRTVQLDLDPATPVGSLSPGERQLVEIAKALRARPRVLLLDEPTTSLAEREVRRLFALVQRLTADGIAVVYVSHNLEDVCRLSDQVVVLRDGEVQAKGPAAEFDVRSLIPLMVGRTIDDQFPPRAPRRPGEALLEVRGLSRAGAAENISFTLHRGEILGVAGLMGAGRTEMARMVFGLDSYDSGAVILDRKPLAKASPRESVTRGMAYLSENRRDEGLLADDAVTANIALASLDRFAQTPLRLIAGHRLDAACDELVARLDIACQDTHRQSVKTLSGGNQQKVALARWLMRDARILILDEPTRGVDVGARQQVYEQIHAAAARGAGVLFISSEIEELIGMCDRILVMSAGMIQTDVPRERFDRDALMAAAFAEVA